MAAMTNPFPGMNPFFRYHLNPHNSDPSPPFSNEEAAWVEERLKAAGLR